MAVAGLKVVPRTYAGTTAPAMARAILFRLPQNNRAGGKLAPSPATKLVTIEYANPFDQSRGEALLELPKNLSAPVP